jgi:hypothetical protein
MSYTISTTLLELEMVVNLTISVGSTFKPGAVLIEILVNEKVGTSIVLP